MLLLRDTVQPLLCTLSGRSCRGSSCREAAGWGTVTDADDSGAGQGALWALLSSFPADPVTSGGKTTKAPGALERKCDSFLLGKTRLVKVCGDHSFGAGRRGREQRIPASAAHQPREAGLQCPSDCLPDGRVWVWCVHMYAHACGYTCVCMCTSLGAQVYVCARVPVCTHVCTCMHTCMYMGAHTGVYMLCAHAIRTCVYVCLCARVCICTRAYMYVYAVPVMCMHMHEHVCMCMCTHVPVYMCMCTHVHACACLCAHAYTHVCICTCAYVHVYACTCVRMCTHVRVYVCLRTHVYTRICYVRVCMCL